MQIRDPGLGNSNPGCKKSDLGWEKFGSGIRDKHPGFATLILKATFMVVDLRVVTGTVMNFCQHLQR